MMLTKEKFRILNQWSINETIKLNKAWLGKGWMNNLTLKNHTFLVSKFKTLYSSAEDIINKLWWLKVEFKAHAMDQAKLRYECLWIIRYAYNFDYALQSLLVE